MSAAMVLFAVGNQILALPFPLCPPSAPLRSLCTPANTRLITLLSIGSRFTPKGKEVLSSLSLFCHSFPLLYPFIICSLFLSALSSPPTSYILLFPFLAIMFLSKHFKNLRVHGWKPKHLMIMRKFLHRNTLSALLEVLFLWCCLQLRSCT